MHRHELTEQEWKILQTALPPRMGRPPRIATRKFLNAVFWKIKTGAPWRDLPKRYGKWKTIYNRFNRWAKANYFEAIFKTLQIEVDNEWNMIDGSYVRVHQHGSGGKGGPNYMLLEFLAEEILPRYMRE